MTKILLATVAVVALATPALAVTPLDAHDKQLLRAAERTCDTRLIVEWMHRYSQKINDCEAAYRKNHQECDPVVKDKVR
jgi:hypothetical protein